MIRNIQAHAWESPEVMIMVYGKPNPSTEDILNYFVSITPLLLVYIHEFLKFLQAKRDKFSVAFDRYLKNKEEKLVREGRGKNLKEVNTVLLDVGGTGHFVETSVKVITEPLSTVPLSTIPLSAVITALSKNSSTEGTQYKLFDTNGTALSPGKNKRVLDGSQLVALAQSIFLHVKCSDTKLTTEYSLDVSVESQFKLSIFKGAVLRRLTQDEASSFKTMNLQFGSISVLDAKGAVLEDLNKTLADLSIEDKSTVSVSVHTEAGE